MKPRTPEHQARVDRMRANLAAMPEGQVVSVLEAVMGFGDDEIDEMGEEEVDAFLRAEGIDPKTSHLSCMGGVLAGLSRTLHDYRDKMTEIHKTAETAYGTGPLPMAMALDRIAKLAVVPPADKD